PRAGWQVGRADLPVRPVLGAPGEPVGGHTHTDQGRAPQHAAPGEPVRRHDASPVLANDSDGTGGPGCGRPNRYPWAWSQPKSRSSANCAESSTPSAMVTSPNAWANRITAITIFRSEGSSMTPDTNDRSILRKLTGNRLRYVNDEYPVPKSSIPMRTPMSRNWLSCRTVVASASMRTVSVISRASACGGRP